MSKAAVELVVPSAEHKKSFIAGLVEFQNEGLSWHLEINAVEVEKHFDDFVQSLLDRKSGGREAPMPWSKVPPRDLVPETVFWALYAGEFAGRISIRHHLNEALKVCGGHIGYDTRPAFRGRGIATQMLALSLPEAKALGLTEILLTCNDDNEASIKVIEKNGGILRERKQQFEGGPLKRYYWIQLF